jgi:hypothetical protein
MVAWNGRLGDTRKNKQAVDERIGLGQGAYIFLCDSSGNKRAKKKKGGDKGWEWEVRWAH